MSKYKVILVDDNLDMLLIGQRIFERADFLFFSAHTANEGLNLALKEHPDIIILDYMMPDMSGTQFIKTIATNSLYKMLRNIPIILLTARPNYIEDLENCYRMGLKAFLKKPFGHRELVNVAENIIKLSKFEKIQETGNSPKLSSSGKNGDWLEDMRIAAGTITSLCKELAQTDKGKLSEQQRMEIEAIYTSSRRLSKLIFQKSSKNTVTE